ncbi:TadE/TadG family type IV pilus assembly protein [Streptomyces sp. WAC01280]|uniref:TadE/TadG family type IV pilus assembly protein n=1 Tax=Streptomyces sp. WAC01280 TaxID=2487424 RepID=UPI000F797F4B|nr:TadE/TadG family type IV pilus assembly protein [Streptomyces sp. WAC01280]RSS55273.1 septum site-determining protein [Streptomyces sp. WAC01280]
MRKRPARRRDRGQAAIEYLGFLPILLIVGLAGLQLGMAAYAAQQAGTAARAAARADTVDVPDGEVRPNAEAAGRAAMSGWIADGSEIDVEGGVATVRVEIPRVLPFWNFDPIVKTVTMPKPQDQEGP